MVDPVDRLKMIFGLILLVSLVALAFTFGIGRVEANTSFGLMPIITTLSTLAGLFGGWAFREKHPPPEPQPGPIPLQDETPPAVGSGEKQGGNE